MSPYLIPDILEHVDYVFITNLTCDNLIIKIVQILFIHRFIHFTHKYHVLKTHLTYINVLINEIQTYE